MSSPRLPFTADDVVALADKQVGIGEVGGNSNVNKFTRWYGVATPWCAIFLMWLFDQLGLPYGDRKGIPWSAWVPTIQSRAKQLGEWVGPNDLRRGDWVLFDEPGGRPPGEGDHIGLIRDADAFHYRTIEGNWGNEVRKLIRYADASDARILGGWRPNYKPATVSHKPASYLLRRGDTLSSVAKKFGTSVRAIVKLNGIDNADKVPAGLRLALPGGRHPTIGLDLARRAVRKGKKAAPETWTLLNEWLPGDAGNLKLRYSKEQQAQGYRGTQPGQDADGDPGMASLSALAKRHGWRAVAKKGGK